MLATEVTNASPSSWVAARSMSVAAVWTSGVAIEALSSTSWSLPRNSSGVRTPSLTSRITFRKWSQASREPRMAESSSETGSPQATSTTNRIAKNFLTASVLSHSQSVGQPVANSSSVQWDIKAFERGLMLQVERIRRGTDAEEERLANVVVDRADPPVLTGELKNSKFTRKVSDGVEFGWKAKHAGYVEYGTEDTPEFGFARASEQRAKGQLKSPI